MAVGLTQEELAERAHLSRRTITNLERGVTAPYRDTLTLLADALRLTESDRVELERVVQRARTPGGRESQTVAVATVPPSAGSDPLLATKLTIPPPRSNLIPRPHLTARLQAGLRGPLTLLSAPAGSGKSSLLSAWRTTPEGRETALAWVTLDAADNDVIRFWRYVLAALDRAASGVSSAALSVLQTPGTPAIEAVVTALVNQLATPGRDIVLVLDDYHVIETEAIHTALDSLIRYRPPCLHILLATRADPPLPLTRLRARGEATELRAGDLRFSQGETIEFFDRAMGLSLSPGEIVALETRTEGWIAGLQLAGLALQGRPTQDRAAFIADFTGSHRYIVDYLLDEVLLRQPEEVQRFLVHTCILDRLCAPLCATVLAGENPSADDIAESQEMLEAMERNNLFLIALDDERRWYRYHHLFADALNQRQGSHASIPHASSLHRRASSWFERQGLLGEAIRHALAAGSYDAAADLMPRALRPIVSRGKPQGILAWLRTIPRAVIQARTDLCLMYAWVFMEMRELRRAEECLHRAEIALERTHSAHSPPERQALQAMIEADRAVISAIQGDADGALGQGRAVLDGLADAGGEMQQVTVTLARNAAGLAQGLAHMSRGAAKEAADAFSGASRVSSDTLARQASTPGPVNTAPVLGAFLAAMGEATAHRLAGDLDLARQILEQIIQWDADRSHLHLLGGNLYTGLADILRERNELNTALKYATYGIKLERELGAARSERWIEWNVCNRLVLARIEQAQGNLDGALADVRTAREELDGSTATAFSRILDAFQAQLHLAYGNIGAAVRWRESMEADETPLRIGVIPPFFAYACEHLEVAPIQVLLAQGRASGDPTHLRRALVLLNPLRDRAEGSGLIWLQVKTRILQALTLDLLGKRAMRPDNPIVLLEEALRLGEPQRYIRAFADEGPPLVALLRQVSSSDLNPGYVATVLASLVSPPQRSMRGTTDQRDGEAHGADVTESLTERELDALRLLVTGQSNREIARALYVEVNTVKTHLKRLYAKLGVHNRVQAVRRARELGIL